jgi:hypothetical protein
MTTTAKLMSQAYEYSPAIAMDLERGKHSNGAGYGVFGIQR